MFVNASRPRWRSCVTVSTKCAIPSVGDAPGLAAMFFAEGAAGVGGERLYEEFDFEISAGQIIAVVGPSGGGKTLLLHKLTNELSGVIALDASRLDTCGLPAVDVVAGATVSQKLEILSRCGLAEARALVRPAANLSGGQKYRLALAVALAEAGRNEAASLLVADEFASSLDELTAGVLCRQIRKVVSSANVALLVASPRVEIPDALEADRVIVKPLGEPPRVVSGRRRRRGRRSVRPGGDPRRWRIRRGSIRDYASLGRFHYLTGPPAAHKRVYVISAPRRHRAAGGPRTAALLVVSPPLPSVRGRNLATDGRYAGADRAAAMDLLNREVECISRVIVHPVCRGCGLAVRLVRHALATAEAPFMEALAAMGHVNPFFERAGMRAYHVGPDPASVRLISAADAVGLSPQEVAAVEPVRKLLDRRRSARARFLRAEVERCIGQSAPNSSARNGLRRGAAADTIADLCRRTARRYVYYFAPSHKENSRCRTRRPRKRR